MGGQGKMDRIIGLDIGYGYTKMVYERLSGITTECFPSVVSNYEIGLDAEGLEGDKEAIIKIGEQLFLCGNEAIKQKKALKFESRDKAWINSIAYEVLCRAALQKYNFPSDRTVIATGLPVAYYKADRERLAKKITEIAKDYGDKCIVKVVPQPLGSFFNMFFDAKGNIINDQLRPEHIGIVDVGFKTTDILAFSEMRPIMRMSTSFDTGISTAYDSIARDIYAEYGLMLEPHTIGQAVKLGYVKTFGEQHDISKFSKNRLTELAEAIRAEVATLWGDTREIDRILLTGGSVLILRTFLDKYKQGRVLENSQTANAAGFFKYAKRVSHE